MSQSDFLSNSNYSKLVGFLRQHYAKQTGVSAISEQVDTRLQKTIQHYMNEVANAHKGKTIPVNILNQEVVRETSSNMDLFLKKKEISGSARPLMTVSSSKPSYTQPSASSNGLSVSSSIAATPTVSNVINATMTGRSIPDYASSSDISRIFDTMDSRFTTQAAERSMMNSPDFRLPQDNIEMVEDPVSLMQRLQKQREEEAKALGIAPAPSASVPAVVATPKLVIREEPAVIPADPIIPPQPTLPSGPLAPRQQDYIIPQEPVVKYLEKEYNVFLTSLDRDWSRDVGENRYNFSVKFNTGNTRLGYGISPAVQQRFRNIVRIEFVKAILPTESLDLVVRNTGTSGAPTYDTSRIYNIFSFPFAAVRIAELNTNGFSTNPTHDNTFAMIHYDATWTADSTNTNKSGYTGVIPKFLKCQRVYEPTPLGSLQKLSIRLERPDGSLLSDNGDALNIAQVFLSSNPPTGITNNSVYGISNDNYIFLRTNEWFIRSAVGDGDRIYIQGVLATGATTAAQNDFENFINRPEGHLVVGIASTDTTLTPISDGSNNVGYANYIVIRSRFADPTTGSVGRSYFGGAGNDTALGDALDDLVQTTSRCINANRQTHIVLRIITREMDSGSNIRPDNV
jgi:hypothetical protein